MGSYMDYFLMLSGPRQITSQENTAFFSLSFSFIITFILLSMILYPEWIIMLLYILNVLSDCNYLVLNITSNGPLFLKTSHFLITLFLYYNRIVKNTNIKYSFRNFHLESNSIFLFSYKQIDIPSVCKQIVNGPIMLKYILLQIVQVKKM